LNLCRERVYPEISRATSKQINDILTPNRPQACLFKSLPFLYSSYRLHVSETYCQQCTANDVQTRSRDLYQTLTADLITGAESSRSERPSASQETKVHQRVKKKPARSKSCVTFSKAPIIHGGELLSPSPNHQVRGPPIFSCPRMLIQYKRSQPPYPPAVRFIHNLRTRRVRMAGIYLPVHKVTITVRHCDMVLLFISYKFRKLGLPNLMRKQLYWKYDFKDAIFCFA
jgi:hypothetical protein